MKVCDNMWYEQILMTVKAIHVHWMLGVVCYLSFCS